MVEARTEPKTDVHCTRCDPCPSEAEIEAAGSWWAYALEDIENARLALKRAGEIVTAFDGERGELLDGYSQELRGIASGVRHVIENGFDACDSEHRLCGWHQREARYDGGF